MLVLQIAGNKKSCQWQQKILTEKFIYDIKSFSTIFQKITYMTLTFYGWF